MYARSRPPPSSRPISARGAIPCSACIRIDARYLWQTAVGVIIIVRNGGAVGALAPTCEVRADSPFAWLSAGTFLSSNPGMKPGGVGLTFYESTR